MRGRAGLALAGLGATVALVACGNILGLKDLELEGDGGTESGADVHADGVAGDDGANEGTTGSDGSDGTVGGDASDARAGDGTGGDAPPETGDGPPLDAPHDTPVDTPVDVPVDTPADTPPDAGCGTLTSCSGTCVDLNTSDQNCGSCGHDCLTTAAGGCVGGVCQPVLMTGVALDAFDIVAVPTGGGGSTLYWVDQSTTAWKCDAASCTPTPIHSGFTNTQRIAYDPSGTGTVFWTDYGSGGAADGAIWKYDVASSTPSSIATGRWTPQGVAADANDVYWAEAFTNQVVQLARSGGTVTPHPTGSGTTPDGLAMLGGEVYWADTGTGVMAHCTEAPCTPAPLLNGLASPVSIGTAPGIVLVTDYSGTGGIWTYDTASTNTAPIGGVQNFPIRVVSDGTMTYWTNFGAAASDGALVGCLGACATGVPIEPNLQKPVGLAIDGKAIYYGTTGNHKLWKLAR
ncbi:MAG TPA: hypothetical protein VIF15_00965 [Polyangiaceae bacterium]